ncbi:MAG: hypothetical protein KFF49_05750 [Bacteroidales bacterium]|nr:hypothetical protein [Bacteroidales bacterium]
MSKKELWQENCKNWRNMLIKREKLYITPNIRLTVIREEYSQDSFFYFNLHVARHDELVAALNYLSGYLAKNKLEILMAFCFGSGKIPGRPEAGILNPLTALYHGTAASSVGFQLICTDSKHVALRKSTGDLCVKSLNHFGTELYFVNNLVPHRGLDNYGQAYSVLQALKDILREYDIGFKGLARTWLYLNDILEWYDELNRARTDFFNEEEIFDAVIPASTGVGLSNISGKSLLLNAFLVKNMENNSIIRMLDSPLQCPATAYKSSFSRAIEIRHKASKRMLISGTASIDRTGETLHYDNIMAQISHTMEVVSSIMSKEEYKWGNMVRAIAYFRDMGHAGHFIEYCRSNQIDSSYILIAGGTICRDDLLFEIELDAVKAI